VLIDDGDRMKLSPEELTAIVRYQVGALKAFLDAEGVPLNHVKVGESRPEHLAMMLILVQAARCYVRYDVP
jgi:lactam utilization protein B